MGDSGSQGPGRQLGRIQAWVEDTERLLQTQSSIKTFDTKDIASLLQTFHDAVAADSSLELVSVTTYATSLLLRVSDNLTGQVAELVKLLQLLLHTTIAFLGRGEDGAAQQSEEAMKLVEQSGTVAATEVLDGVLGFLLEVVNSDLEFATRRCWLEGLVTLVRGEVDRGAVEALGEEYRGDLGKLVDFLGTCGDYPCQAALLEVLVR